MDKQEMLSLLLGLFNDCGVVVNDDNMERFDESPDYAVDHDELIRRIKQQLSECID